VLEWHKCRVGWPNPFSPPYYLRAGSYFVFLATRPVYSEGIGQTLSPQSHKDGF
jgi:hypothetical protein